MLNVEQEGPATGAHDAPLTYGSYLKIPDLLQLQRLLGPPDAHDEMLFIIVQQAQELWFKQILFEFESIIPLLDSGDIIEAMRLLNRVNVIMRVLANEVEVLEQMPPQEFGRFRHLLAPSSGFESEQFRELEYASGLREHTFLKLLETHGYIAQFRSEWPVSLYDAFVGLLTGVEADTTLAIAEVYRNNGAHPHLYMLAEALSEYEVLFSRWRFNHVKLVERAIGDSVPGTGGSSGAGYLGKTLTYRFFPGLWAARNVITRSEH